MEDRGYVVDLGIKGVKAFMKSLDAEKYVQLHNEGIFYLHLEKQTLDQIHSMCLISRSHRVCSFALLYTLFLNLASKGLYMIWASNGPPK